jgi:hypothetical protein
MSTADSERLTYIFERDGTHIDDAIKEGVARAIERHRRLGESIVIWRDGHVVTIPADEIPPLEPGDAPPFSEQSDPNP